MVEDEKDARSRPYGLLNLDVQFAEARSEILEESADRVAAMKLAAHEVLQPSDDDVYRVRVMGRHDRVEIAAIPGGWKAPHQVGTRIIRRQPSNGRHAAIIPHPLTSAVPKAARSPGGTAGAPLTHLVVDSAAIGCKSRRALGQDTRDNDAAGRAVKHEFRGRELELLEIVQFVDLDDGERVATRPGESTLETRLPWSAEQVGDEVRRMVYDDGDRQPRWLRLKAGLEAREVRVDDAALGALPLELEFDDLAVARYGE